MTDRLSSNAISPSLGSISRQMMRDVVLFPEPDSPTRPTLSPALIVIEKSATAAAPIEPLASFCTSSSGGVPGAGSGQGATCIAICRPLLFRHQVRDPRTRRGRSRHKTLV